MTDLWQRSGGFGSVIVALSNTPPLKLNPPECVEDDGALVKLNAGVQQLGGHHRGVAETGRLAADFFTVENNVFPMSSEEERRRWSTLWITCARPLYALWFSDLCSRPLSLSPTLITMTSFPALVSLAISFLMVLATPEWMAPHSPRSEVTPMIKCLPDLTSGALISAFSYSAGESNNEH